MIIMYGSYILQQLVNSNLQATKCGEWYGITLVYNLKKFDLFIDVEENDKIYLQRIQVIKISVYTKSMQQHTNFSGYLYS